MKTTVTGNAEELTVAVVGEINSVTSVELAKTMESLPLEKLRLLLLDLAGVEYISSAGLRVLLAAQDRMGDPGAMKIVHVSEAVLQIFEITGFIGTLDIEAADRAW